VENAVVDSPDAVTVGILMPGERSACENQLISARYDEDRAARRCHERAYVARVAGEDPVAGRGDGHDACVHRVRHTGSAQEHPGLTAKGFIYGLNVDRLEQPGEVRLAPSGISPDLGDHDGRTA
jgi:hypothetical protein